MMQPTVNEKSETLAKAFQEQVPKEVLQQVLTVSTDDPSPKMEKDFREVLSALQFLALDPVHLCIAYRDALGRKQNGKPRYAGQGAEKARMGRGMWR